MQLIILQLITLRGDSVDVPYEPSFLQSRRQNLGRKLLCRHRPVNLVSAFSTSVFTGKELEEMGSSNKKPSSLRASNTDSIVIAKVYAEQSESGHKRPAKKVAELLNLDASMVYVAVRIARKNGWLTSAGSGSSGGLLTPNGISMFESVKGNEILYSLLRKDNL